MAVVDSASADLPATVGSSIAESNGSGDSEHHPSHLSRRMVDPSVILRSPSLHDHSFQMKLQLPAAPPAHVGGHQALAGGLHGIDAGKSGFRQVNLQGADFPTNGEVGDEGFRRDMRDLEELLSKLNPMAEEFVPPSLAAQGSAAGFYSNGFGVFNGGGRRV